MFCADILVGREVHKGRAHLDNEKMIGDFWPDAELIENPNSKTKILRREDGREFVLEGLHRCSSSPHKLYHFRFEPKN
jgi:hypothetical protein